MAECTEKCKDYKVKKSRSSGRYANGQKRCQYCEIFIQWDGLFCPCCTRRLRCGPRSRQGKEKYQKEVVSQSHC
ncbi:MAG: hypothetical protein ACE5Q4_00480 [Nitrosopumilus sp.]|uniref:Uncharacterized protein n=2 Tax=Candidatus Nitrosomaritimum aestuariumsis TaxID=3342354 RepID=A0AC60WAP6_9ARCH|nr:hypothetical protein [Nitrosopumilaceae archaeon]MBA4459499.1 hypothetical protein [Nitrosopumilaceae archaeon]MBA4462311.1 hypothetical protein [Nitrosopumilaceae archaeon]MBA4464305.1 hypothetical protein [Nitrosopumilaceae archaeon]NCF22513.1 hypothetical protein [Nitrosopumilaceae archaeon]